MIRGATKDSHFGPMVFVSKFQVHPLLGVRPGSSGWLWRVALVAFGVGVGVGVGEVGVGVGAVAGGMWVTNELSK